MSELYKRNVTDTKFENDDRDREIDVLSPFLGEDDDDLPELSSTMSYRRGGRAMYSGESHMDINMGGSDGKERAWNFFRESLRQSKPLKIRNWALLREGGDAFSSFLDERGKLHPSYDELVRSMPADALDAAVTVQTKQKRNTCTCKTCDCEARGEAVPCEREEPKETDTERPNKRAAPDTPHTRHAIRSVYEQKNRQLVNSKLTIAQVPLGGEENTFYGQEDQLTAEMRLGDVLGGIDPERKICVAQENIFSNRDDAGIDDDGNSADVSVSNDGRCAVEGSHNPASLAMLLPWIRIPSFLLPSIGGIDVKEINFWMCPKECRTNTHYDGHHNILLVLSGNKTVELSPPGAFRGSPIHSDHANHPYLLRCTQVGGHLANDWFRTDTSSLDNQAKCNNIVVSITAGEAVFIPEGWWHRVESSDRCMAINVWFDHDSSSTSATSHNDNPHMLPYQAREMVRRYIDANIEKLNEVRVRMAYMGLLGRYGSVIGVPVRDPGRVVLRFLESMNTTEWIRRERSNDEIHRGLQIIGEYAHHLLGVAESGSAKTGTVPPLQKLLLSPGAQSLGLMISFFLTLLNPKMTRDRIAMVALFDRFPAVHTHEKREVFTAIVKSITQEACYNLSIAWEKHTPSDQAQASYSSVFGRCVGDEGRRYFMTQIDAFRNESARKLICGDLMLLNPMTSFP
ncbi:hypothetical protein ACHAXT_010485 [Thalassiosira profunda]